MKITPQWYQTKKITHLILTIQYNRAKFITISADRVWEQYKYPTILWHQPRVSSTFIYRNRYEKKHMLCLLEPFLLLQNESKMLSFALLPQHRIQKGQRNIDTCIEIEL
jgi:hypothetical protein